MSTPNRKLKAARAIANLTQHELANRCRQILSSIRSTQCWISEIELGQTVASELEIFLLSTALRVKPEQINNNERKTK